MILETLFYINHSGVIYFYDEYSSDGRNSGTSLGVCHEKESFKVWSWNDYGHKNDMKVGAKCLARW